MRNMPFSNDKINLSKPENLRAYLNDLYRSKYAYYYKIALTALEQTPREATTGGLKEMAHDAVQNTFEKVLNGLDRINDIDNLAGYLGVMVRHQAFDLARMRIHGAGEYLYGDLHDLSEAEFEKGKLGEAIGRRAGRDNHTESPELLAERVQTDRLLQRFYSYALEGAAISDRGDTFDKPRRMSADGFERGLFALRRHAQGLTALETARELANLDMLPRFDETDPKSLVRAVNLVEQTIKRMKEHLRASLENIHPELEQELAEL